MLLFDSYDEIFDFLHENLPDKTRYEFLYGHVGSNNHAKYPPHDKYGKQRVPYAVFLDLQKHGYAYWIESKEIREKSFDGQKMMLLWTRIERDLESSIFPSQLDDQFKLISINDACKFLGLTRPSVYKLINDQEIPVVQIFDKTKRIQMKDLLRYIESKKQLSKK